MIDVHRRPVTDVIHDKGCEPFECLAAFSFVGPLDNIKGVDNSNNVQNEDKVMDGVEYLVAELVAQEGSYSKNQEESEDTITCYHNLRCEFIAELLFAVGT